MFFLIVCTSVCRKNRLVERGTRINQMLNDPSYISQGTLYFAYGKLFVKIIGASIEENIVAALDHLNVSREKEIFFHKKEQETAGKERFVVGRTVRINVTCDQACLFLWLEGPTVKRKKDA